MSGLHADSERPPQTLDENPKRRGDAPADAQEEAADALHSDALTSKDSIRAWGATRASGGAGGVLLLVLLAVVVTALVYSVT